jgi:hypothetical protein
MTGFVLDGYDPQGFYCEMLRCAARRRRGCSASFCAGRPLFAIDLRRKRGRPIKEWKRR